MLVEILATLTDQRKTVELTLVAIMPVGAVAARELALVAGAIVISNLKIGISSAINRGLPERRGERYYAWIGDDDLFRTGGLQWLQSMLDADLGAVLAYEGCDLIDPQGVTIATGNAGELVRFLLPWGPNLIPQPGTMLRLDDLESIGGFDDSLKYAMDLNAFLALRRFGSFISSRDKASAFHWHPGSITVAGRLNSSREAEAVKRSHLNPMLRAISPAWHLHWRWASSFATNRLSARARELA